MNHEYDHTEYGQLIFSFTSVYPRMDPDISDKMLDVAIALYRFRMEDLENSYPGDWIKDVVIPTGRYMAKNPEKPLEKIMQFVRKQANKTHPYCYRCGSDNITRTCEAVWDRSNRKWVVALFTESFYCEQCKKPTEANWH